MKIPQLVQETAIRSTRLVDAIRALAASSVCWLAVEFNYCCAFQFQTPHCDDVSLLQNHRQQAKKELRSLFGLFWLYL